MFHKHFNELQNGLVSAEKVSTFQKTRGGLTITYNLKCFEDNLICETNWVFAWHEEFLNKNMKIA